MPMERKNGEQTVLTKATPKSDSLRTTVPMSIVKQFGLTEGDRLKWEIQARDNELVVMVTPASDEVRASSAMSHARSGSSDSSQK